MDYYSIRETAKAYKMRVEDFFAMSNDCDPFYIKNNPNKMKLVDWFRCLYDQYWDLLNDKMLRSLHYLLLHHLVCLPDGTTRYKNLDEHYDMLLDAAKYARYVGVVPFDIVQEVHNPVDVYIPESLAVPDISIDKDTPLLGFWPFPYRPKYEFSGAFPCDQHFVVEIWCEKTYSPFQALAKQYGAVWQRSTGEQTLACVSDLFERIRTHKRPTRILYISDYDPAGTSMPLTVSRKLEYLIHEAREKGEDIQDDVRLYTLALTSEQIERFDLPRTPLKKTEKRANIWQAVHGEDAVELNAIEAQPEYRGALVEIVEDAILQYYDTSLHGRVNTAKQELATNLARIQNEIYQRYPRFAELERRYEEIEEQVGEYLENMSTETKQILEAIEQEIENETPDMEEYLTENPLPTSHIKGELPYEPLLDGKRDYFDQLTIYKTHQGKRIVY